LNSCLIIAGEKSGEEHAMSFFPKLKQLSPNVSFYGVGGDELKSLDVELLYHLKDFSSMGFSEVVGKIPFYFKALKRLEEEVIKRQTKTAILIDFQDFNLRLAQRLNKLGVNVLYYVAPQAWAWKAHRAEVLSQTVHTLFTILPFEKKWFGDRGVHQVKGIPHPLMLTYREELHQIPQKPFRSWGKKLKLLLLPGSRKFEIHSLLPEFINSVNELRKSIEVEVHLVKVSHVSDEIYQYYQDQVDVWHPSERLVSAMKECHLALAASGTVTLSTGLFELPTVVCYKASLLNEFVFYNLIKYQGPISLTNIVHEKMVFPELVQAAVNSRQIARIIKSWIQDEKVYNDLKETLKQTKSLLSGEDFSVPEYMAQVIHG
jgi:lipid-A-disaccharide synthase